MLTLTHQHQWSACGQSPGCPASQQRAGCSPCPHRCRCCGSHCHPAHPMHSDCWRHSGWNPPVLFPAPLGPENDTQPSRQSFNILSLIWLHPENKPWRRASDTPQDKSFTSYPLTDIMDGHYSIQTFHILSSALIGPDNIHIRHSVSPVQLIPQNKQHTIHVCRTSQATSFIS